jgi:hydrogenase maturation protein HypF
MTERLADVTLIAAASLATDGAESIGGGHRRRYGFPAAGGRRTPMPARTRLGTVHAVTSAVASVRRRVRVRGVVQGVGFRPFVSRLAEKQGLGGFVLNDDAGVLIEVEGDAGALDGFLAALQAEAPPLAQVESITVEPCEPRGSETFAIRSSSAGAGAGALIPPDVATCADCLRELFDPANRRYRYPFLNCTQCGPRFTIVRRIPYDRPNTTMAGFPLCTECRREYEDPLDRRFRAEPIACPACGPRLSMPIEEAVGLLRDGAVVAVKGLGGYHLACDATSETAVERLRARKQREEKPLAVMTGDPGSLAVLDPGEQTLLESPARPIVLVRRLPGAPVAASVAPGSPWLGLMLPYTPLHHLLWRDAGRPLVLTSGNRSDEPIAFDDLDARRRLGDIADAFLAHDRPIHRRCEDSVVRAAFPVRRSRGFAPASLPLPVAAGEPLVAAGAELKATFCVARGGEAFLSAHLGDLDGEAAYRAFRADLELYLRMLDVEPAAIACDLHPEYLATKWAREQGLPLVEVQHHHAHAAACLAEHGETGEALAIVLDGTGYGPDGTLWGGEVLRCDLASFERVAHLAPVPLPGGEAAIREPWRMAALHLERAGIDVPWESWRLVRESLRANAPLSSGAGRLFDAVAALLGVRERVTYEGQAAIELEHLAASTPAAAYVAPAVDGVIDGNALIRQAHADLVSGRPRAEIAAACTEGIAAAFAQAAAGAREPRTVVLSGGCFQNLRLLASTARRLERLGFRVLSHRAVPPNDGGIAYGQAAVAAARLA